MRRIVLLALAGSFVAVAARAQFVPMSRCRAALPCSIPFSISYRPDPLIAGPYGSSGNTGFVFSVPVGFPLAPRIEKPQGPDFGAALEADIRRTMQSRPPAKKSEASAKTPQAPEEQKPAPPAVKPDDSSPPPPH